MKLLRGHISPETAYVVEDYPYGFRLRCKIRYWLEHKPGFGVRLVSQTSNPKRGDTWNKPKASTYGRYGGAMFLDDDNHVTWSALTEYTDGAEATAWREQYGDGVPETARADMDHWIAVKCAYDARKAAGQAWNDPATVAGAIADVVKQSA